MKVKFISDFHTEFMQFNKLDKTIERKFPTEEDDKDTILCCAGDMGLFSHYPSTYKPFFAIMSKRFREVICISGNHSYYNTGWWGQEKLFWADKKLPKNVHYLNNTVKVIDGVAFIGSTLWTNFHNSDPIAMFTAQRGMNDFIVIKKREMEVGPYGSVYNSQKLTPEDSIVRFNESIAFITEMLDKYKTIPCVVVTHHAPSADSIGAMWKGSILNAAYYSNLEPFIMDHPQIKYWHHGHMHSSFRYMVGETEIICNPFGYYYQEENKTFDPTLVVEVGK